MSKLILNDWNSVTSRYIVLENGKPATYHWFNTVHESWDNAHFDSFADAIKYANNWLSDVYCRPVKEWQVNVPFNYNGEDIIEIRALDYLDGYYLQSPITEYQHYINSPLDPRD